jgi:hypothetical protein
VLALVAALPRFRGGPIGLLQDIVEHNKSDALNTQKQCRPPDGATIEFRHFRLIELFLLEDFGDMSEGLRTVFSSPDRYPYPNYLDEFEGRADDLFAGGWTAVGTLIRSGNPFFWAGRARRMPDLPEEVQSISLTAHKLLPSLFAITADVFLTDKATERIRSIQEGLFFPEVTFRYWNPRKWPYGHTTKPSGSLASEAVLSWIEGLRFRVEMLLHPFFKGHFLAKRGAGRARLPAIETYGLFNVPFGPDFAAWKRNAWAWWGSLGFDPAGMNSYEGAERMFSWGEHGFRVARLCTPKSESGEPFSSSNLTDALNRILPGFAVRVLLDSLEEDFIKARRRAYQQLMSSRLTTRLGREIVSVQELSRRSLVLNRLEVEFEDGKARIAHEARHLSDMVNSVIPGRPSVTLDTAIINGIGWKARVIQQHVRLLTQAFSEHISILNTRVMYRLQRALFWLTLAYTVLTLIAVVANWPQLEMVWGKLQGRLPRTAH